VVIEMAFPFAVDRPYLETWLPRTAATAWLDDRTVRLTYPETESNIGFKIPETRAADGSATIEWFVVTVAFPATRVVSLYTVTELTSGARVPIPATTVRVGAAGPLKVSPDGRRAVAYAYLPTSVPAIVDLLTRASTPVTGPAAADGPFVFVDWLPDGRLLIVGRTVWLGDGVAMRMVADAVAALGLTPWAAVPDPTGGRLALSGSVADGHVAVVDLRTGSVARITGPFRPVRSESGITLAWSKDGALLAGTDSDPESATMATRVRIVDLATDRTMRTIEGPVRSVSSFPTGELLVVRHGDRIRELLGVVMGFDGVEHRRYVGGGSWWMSPDAKHLLQMEPNGGAGYPPLSLIDLATGRSSPIGAPAAFVGWLADGRLAFADGR
jgi:WD40 repeat protein